MPPASSGAPAPPNPSQSPDYSFIMSPPEAPKSNKVPSSNSLWKRLVLIFAVLVIVLILFSVVKNFLSNSPNQSALIGVAQDQQVLIHLTSTASQQQQGGENSLSTGTQNLVATTEPVMVTAQGSLLNYMKNNGMKVKSKQLTLKISGATDSQISASVSAGTYDPTFRQIMQNELGTYEQDLRHAYSLTKGPKGRQLLSNQYNGAQLLLQQLTSPAS